MILGGSNESSVLTLADYRGIAETGIQVSPVGLGTVKLGRNSDVKYPHAFDLPDDQSVLSLLALAQDLGINLLDTAPAYGCSEQRLGQLLSCRQDWVISSKVGEQYTKGHSYFDFSCSAIEHSLQQSLRHLKTDYLDVVLLHSNGEDEWLLQQTEALETLLRLRQKGSIRAIGMSSKTVSGGRLALDMGCDVVMVALNPLDVSQQEILNKALQMSRGVFIKKAFASGHLQAFGEHTVADIFDFLFAQKAITSVVLGTINPEHLRSNVEAAQNALRA